MGAERAATRTLATSELSASEPHLRRAQVLNESLFGVDVLGRVRNAGVAMETTKCAITDART